MSFLVSPRLKEDNHCTNKMTNFVLIMDSLVSVMISLLLVMTISLELGLVYRISWLTLKVFVLSKKVQVCMFPL